MTTAADILLFLKVEEAPSDTDRAQVLSALCRYARKMGLTELEEAAAAAMPQAHPFVPAENWERHYIGAFEQTADPDCGVCPDESVRYAREYWQSLTDAQRRARVETPSLGAQDGEKDAGALNDA